MNFRCSLNLFAVFVVWLLQVYLSKALGIGGFRSGMVRNPRSTFDSYYVGRTSTYKDSISIGVFVGIVFGCLFGLMVSIFGSYMCCVYFCGKNSKHSVRVVRQQSSGVTPASSTQIFSISTENSVHLCPATPQSLQHQEDSFKYSEPPPTYEEAVNCGLQAN